MKRDDIMRTLQERESDLRAHGVTHAAVFGSVARDVRRSVKTEDSSLIDRAAHLLGKSRTEFMLEAARRAAQDALLDQTLFTVSPKIYAEFVARLDAPPAPNDRLRRTMTAPTPWQ